jgi:hypothetical protein
VAEPLSAAQSAAASPIVDNIFALVDQGIELVGEDALTALINEKLDIPVLTESMEALVIGYIVKKIHAVVHRPAPAPPTP